MTRFSRIILNAPAFALALCAWVFLLAASAAAQSQNVSGLNLRMVDFAENAFVLIAPGQWQEIDKRNWQRGSIFREIQRNANEVHIRDDSRNIGFAFRPQQMQAWIVLNTPQYEPYANIQNVSSQARIPGSDVAWDAGQAPQQAAQPQPQPDPRLARHKAHEDAIHAQYPEAKWLTGQYDATQRKLNFAQYEFQHGFQVTASNGSQVAATRIYVTPAAYTGSDNNQYIVLDFDGTVFDATSVPYAQAANQDRDRGWYLESATLSVTPITNSVSMYYEGQYGFDSSTGSIFSSLQPRGTLAHIQGAFSSKPMWGFTASTSGDSHTRYANYRLSQIIDIDKPNSARTYSNIQSLIADPKPGSDVEGFFQATGEIFTGRAWTTSRLHKLPDQAFNGLKPVYQVVYITNEHFMPIAFRVGITMTLNRMTVQGEMGVTGESYKTDQAKQLNFSQDFVVDLGAMQ